MGLIVGYARFSEIIRTRLAMRIPFMQSSKAPA
jgi:hypothetical protein